MNTFRIGKHFINLRLHCYTRLLYLAVENDWALSYGYIPTQLTYNIVVTLARITIFLFIWSLSFSGCICQSERMRKAARREQTERNWTFTLFDDFIWTPIFTKYSIMVSSFNCLSLLEKRQLSQSIVKNSVVFILLYFSIL